jgi:hypothetical protein
MTECYYAITVLSKYFPDFSLQTVFFILGRWLTMKTVLIIISCIAFIEAGTFNQQHFKRRGRNTVFTFFIHYGEFP